MRWRDAPEVSDRLTSFSIEGLGSRALPRSSWCVHRCCGWSVFAVDTLTVDSQVALINLISIFRLRDESLLWGVGGGSAYVWYKNTSARLCTKNVGGLMCERGGGIFAGHYSTKCFYCC